MMCPKQRHRSAFTVWSSGSLWVTKNPDLVMQTTKTLIRMLRCGVALLLCIFVVCTMRHFILKCYLTPCSPVSFSPDKICDHLDRGRESWSVCFSSICLSYLLLSIFFLFLLVSGVGCCLLLLHSLDFSFEPPHDKTDKMTCAPSEDTDQPGHLPSLIRAFTVHMKKPWVLSYPLSAQWRLIRLGGCPGWSESSLGAHAILLVGSFNFFYRLHVFYRFCCAQLIWFSLTLESE